MIYSKDAPLIQQAVYSAADLQGLPHLDSQPGEAPYVRGPYARMYRERPWTIRQYTGFASAEASNAAFHRSLAEGGQGLSVAFDLPTHLGFDSDHPAALADVGRTGVAIDSVEDMKRLFAGIDLGEVSVSMTMNGAVLPILAAYIVAAEETGVPRDQLRGTIQNDILKEFMVRNTYIFGPEPSLRICADIVEYLSEELPAFNSMSISGYHFQEAGAGPALELALTLANARAYLDAVTERGLDLDRFCHRLSFFFGVGMNFYEEIAKLRAARLLWHEEVSQRGAQSDQATRMKMHCQTSGWSLTAQEPHNNLMRTTIEAMAAVFGGTQSLHTNAFDEALSLPTDASARLARNTQLVLQHEAQLCDVVDPWGGSYLMESLTHRMAEEVRRYLRQIDGQGGIVAAIRSGWVSDRIHRRAAETQGEIDSGQRTIVGVNRFTSTQSQATNARHIDAEQLAHEQRQRLQHLRQDRDSLAVDAALAALTDAARRGHGNLLALTLDAIRARASVGECTRALLRVWPRHRADSQFSADVYAKPRRTDTAWRRVQRQVARFRQTQRRSPSILIVKLGLDGHDRGARVVAAGLTDAGFHVELGPLFGTPQQVLQHLRKTGFDALGISVLSGAHLSLVRELRATLDTNGFPGLPVFVGGVIPAEHHESLTALGIAQIHGPGTTMEVIAESVLKAIGSGYASAAPRGADTVVINRRKA